MGKDSGWKRYFSDNRRYADIINGIGCEGKQLVQEADLDDADSQGRTKKTRDLIRKTAFGVNFALIGIENQDTMDYEIPLRTMHYDVAEYEKQAAEIRRKVRENRNGLRAGEYLYGYRKSDKLKPVITFVLYSGKEVWDGPTSLQEMLDFIRCSEDKEKLRQLVENDVSYRNMDEDAYDVVAWYTNSTELMQVRDYQREDGKIDMCTAIREMMEDSRKEGISTGIKALIETCRELGLSREDTLLRTANKFCICKDEVEDYMAKYWK